MFINPGGPGDTGLGLVQGDPDGLDAFGDGRFDVVSWDPRGTHASTRVKCFTSQRSESRFWAGVTVPTTKAESEGFGARPPPTPGAAARSAAGFCPTSRPPTPPATSTTCAS